MHRRCFLQSAAAAAALATPARPQTPRSEIRTLPVDFGSAKQVFADWYFVEAGYGLPFSCREQQWRHRRPEFMPHGVTLRLYPPLPPAAPVLLPDTPTDGVLMEGVTSPPLIQSRFMFLGIEHTAIASPDPQKLAQWYVDHLEFVINYTYQGNYFVKARNGTMLEIIPSVGERGSNQPKDPGLRHLAIIPEDFDAAYAHLQAKGVRFLGEPFVIEGNRLVFFADGDGNICHLIHRETPLP